MTTEMDPDRRSSKDGMPIFAALLPYAIVACLGVSGCCAAVFVFTTGAGMAGGGTPEQAVLYGAIVVLVSCFAAIALYVIRPGD